MKKFLIVDDSSFVQKQIQAFLESHQFEVCGIAKNGEEGVEMYRSLKPDIVTLDITMPLKSGKDCLQDILDFDAEARCIMVSAIKEQDIVMECLKIGAKAYINKPLKFRDESYCEEFLGTIEEALED